MAAKPQDRFVWAVEQLDIQPESRVLEIGYGHGAAATLICERLTTGHLTGLDRSAKMRDMATSRNAAYVDAGRAEFTVGALEEAEFEAGAFDRIFAFNVNLFWTEPGKGLDKVRRWLAPNGTFTLFYMPPTDEWLPYYGESLKTTLEANGFTVRDIRSQPMAKSAVLCVIASTS